MSFRQLYILALIAAAVVSFGMAAWVQARGGKGKAVRAFIVLLIAGSFWPLLAALQAATYADSLEYWIFVLRSIVAWVVPALWLVFVLLYTDREHWLSRPVVTFIAGHLLLVSVLATTNDGHHLIWQNFSFPNVEGGDIPLVDADEAIGYSVHIVVVYAYVVIGLIVLFRQFLTSRHAARGQVSALMLAIVIPFGMNIANNLDVLPRDDINYTALGIAAFAVFSAWGMFSQHLFTSAPLARDTILELIDEGIIVVDREWRVVDYNARADASFPGISQGIGEPIEAVVNSLVTHADDDSIERFVDQVTITTQEGRTDFEVTVSPLGESEADARGYALILEDVTDVEQYQTQVQQQNERLEHVAKTISHDLRNPVNVAEGFLEIARTQGDFSKLDRVERAIERIDEITDEVLTLARQDQAIGEREPVRLERIVEDAWEMSDTREATLTVEPDVVGTTVYADPERLQTALENLFRNAVDHGSTGNQNPQNSGDCVEYGPDDVTVRVGTHEGGFYVADDGPGIDPAEREDVFEYEYTTSDEGTGLGLFTVRTIAEGHGWEVHATESEFGGARFEFDGVGFVTGEVPDAETAMDRVSSPGST